MSFAPAQSKLKRRDWIALQLQPFFNSNPQVRNRDRAKADLLILFELEQCILLHAHDRNEGAAAQCIAQIFGQLPPGHWLNFYTPEIVLLVQPCEGSFRCPLMLYLHERSALPDGPDTSNRELRWLLLLQALCESIILLVSTSADSSVLDTILSALPSLGPIVLGSDLSV